LTDGAKGAPFPFYSSWISLFAVVTSSDHSVLFFLLCTARFGRIFLHFVFFLLFSDRPPLRTNPDSRPQAASSACPEKDRSCFLLFFLRGSPFLAMVSEDFRKKPTALAALRVPSSLSCWAPPPFSTHIIVPFLSYLLFAYRDTEFPSLTFSLASSLPSIVDSEDPPRRNTLFPPAFLFTVMRWDGAFGFFEFSLSPPERPPETWVT